MEISALPKFKSVEEINQLQKAGLPQYSTAALYLVYLAQKNFSKKWCQGLRSDVTITPPSPQTFYTIEDYLDLSWFYHRQLPLPTFADSILKNYRLRGMSDKARLAWDYWSQNPKSLVLVNYIPAVREVLEMQASGKRCVTMIAKSERMGQEIFAGKDAYQFLLHDLDHAACFFQKGDWKEGQIGLYRFMLDALLCPDFENTLNDLVFKEKLDYALSDMNAHCIHLIKYIKGILIEHALRMFGQKSHERMNSDAQTYLQMLIKGIKATTSGGLEILQALTALNNPGEEQYFINLEQFFNQYERRAL